jgi:carbon-monoxide dehydrogenase small subunit
MSDHTVIFLNGVAVPAPHPGMRLLDWLRDEADDRSPKEGCAVGQCGSCAVLVDGRPVPSCCTLVHTAAGRQVWTASGLVRTTAGRAVQDALAEHGAIQCGFCAPGMTVVCVGWLTGRAADTLTRADAADALGGNICRCSGYARLIDALLDAAARTEGTAP